MHMAPFTMTGPVVSETKEEQLKRLQDEQLRKIGRRLKDKGGPPPTTSLQDLELARSPLPNNPISDVPQFSPPNWSATSAADETPSSPRTSHIVNMRLPSHQKMLGMPVSYAPSSEALSASKSSSKWRNPRWATHEELKPIQMETGSNAWGSDLPSDASTADADSTKAMHQGKLFRHNPPGETDTSLVGWDGKWQPPPVDWNDRPRFNNNSLEYRNGFNHWLNGEVCFDEIPVETVLNLDLHPDGLGFVGFKEGVNERNASRKYGFPSDVVDIVRHVARLEDYEYLKDWGKLDLKYEDNAKFRLETTESLVKNWFAQKTRRRQSQSTPQPAHNVGAIAHAPSITNPKPEPEPEPNAPQVNIYLRPAIRTDTDQLTELYNWYVLNSPRTTDIELIQSWEMKGRLDDCLSAKLPFIVAVSREHKSLRRLKGTERIVGFASATDFSQSNLTERISAELEVYVHPDWTHKGVGRTLIDKLLDSTDRGHLLTATATFTCDPDIKHLYSAGGGRDLNVLIFIIRHFKNPRPGADEDISGLKEWLINEFGFEESGCIKGAGTKFKRLMNMTYMTKETKWQPPDGNVPDPLNTT
jgi:L-amino acid N-acyltransferase YncA